MEKILGEAGSLSKDPLFVPLEEKNSIETKLKNHRRGFLALTQLLIMIMAWLFGNVDLISTLLTAFAANKQGLFFRIQVKQKHADRHAIIYHIMHSKRFGTLQTLIIV